MEMHRRVGWLVTAGALCVGVWVSDAKRCDGPAGSTPVFAAGGELEVASSEAIAMLRARGRAGLDEALAAYDAAEGKDPRLERVLDEVAASRDTATARLFWETDLEHALAEARRREVPVLSLRLLGRLTDERSCANSRFFRMVLYADPQLSRWLDSNFVLHWSTERPVPQVTIDFGDGREIQTTTTGNSAHYVLSTDGAVVDVLPGLYTPKGFQAALEDARSLEAKVRAAPQRAAELLQRHHAAALEAAQAELTGRIGRTGHAPVPASTLKAWMLRASDPGPRTAEPPARIALPLAIGKGAVEMPLVAAVGLGAGPDVGPAAVLGEGSAERAIDAVAALDGARLEFSGPTLERIRGDRPPRPDEAEADYELRLRRLREGFAELVVRDELTNEYRHHAIIHRWFAEAQVRGDFASLNERVYRELFLTPRTDPWLGLLDDAIYDALPEAGVTAQPG